MTRGHYCECEGCRLCAKTNAPLEPISINPAEELCKDIGIVHGRDAQRKAELIVEATLQNLSENRANRRVEVLALGESVGFGQLMRLAEEIWGEREIARGTPGGQHTVGPCAALLVPCICQDRRDSFHCDWCCGSGRVTKRVHAISKGMESELKSIAAGLRLNQQDVSARRIDNLIVELLRFVS